MALCIGQPGTDFIRQINNVCSRPLLVCNLPELVQLFLKEESFMDLRVCRARIFSLLFSHTQFFHL